MLDTIREMEEKLNRCRAAADALEEALDAFDGVRDDLAALEAWYGSDDWFAHLAADERGELPSDLRRGVLPDVDVQLLHQPVVLEQGHEDAGADHPQLRVTPSYKSLRAG